MTTSPKSNVTPLRPAATPARTGRTGGGAITPSQRAAVIIALLGESAARPIVEKLDDAALAKIVTALEHISVLAREELAEIVIDFLTQLRASSGALRGGRSRARELMSGIVDPARLNALFGGEEDAGGAGADEDADVWERLRQREPQKVAEYLGRLSPNVIALVLRKLDAGAASGILCMLPDEKVSPTLGHMVEATKVDPGVDSVLERMIEMEFLNNQEQEADSGDGYLETIGEVLSLIPDQKRDSLVSFLRAQHESKLAIIQKGLFTIEELPDILPRNSVPVVFREIEADEIAKVLASLRTSYPQVSDYLLGNISSRMAEQFRDQLSEIPDVPQETADTLQRDFLTRLMDMKRRGVITMAKGSDYPS